MKWPVAAGRGLLSKAGSTRTVSFVSLSEEQIDEKFQDFDYQKALKRARKKMKLKPRAVDDVLFQNTFLGHELVAALIEQKICQEASEAMYVAEKLLENHLIVQPGKDTPAASHFTCTLSPYAFPS
mmetsp:Transcript_7667/g.16360  ORF Transcript_7667/g.16360 Transcript_7667/m.16360 type:complete len:126 (-) Transcript_7667:328-705(-)